MIGLGFTRIRRTLRTGEGGGGKRVDDTRLTVTGGWRCVRACVRSSRDNNTGWLLMGGGGGARKKNKTEYDFCRDQS